MRIKFRYILDLVLALTMLSCNSNNTHSATTTQGLPLQVVATDSVTKSQLNIDTIIISAPNLTAGYVANEVKADHDYKNKLLAVTGVVIDIKRGMGDNIFVVLNGSEKFRAVQCYFNNEETAQKLKKGMKVTFVGICDGLMANVILKNCQLLENVE